MNKLKSFLTKSSDKLQKSSKGEQLEPVVGFKLTLDSGENSSTSDNRRNHGNAPELHVHLIGARHLPSSFGLKSVEGYMIKIKLFPGSTKYDSSVQTSSWPKFNETFKFPLSPPHKSAVKSKKKDSSMHQTLPEKCFEGNFVVLTVFALLEIPAGSVSAIKEKYIALKRKSSFLMQDGKGDKQKADEKEMKKKEEEKDKDRRIPGSLTISESQRNIGSVTWFLDPKFFEENFKNNTFSTEEMWLPIRDLTKKTVDPSKVSVHSSVKGQIELFLELCEIYGDEVAGKSTTTVDTKESSNPQVTASGDSKKSSFNLGSMKNIIKFGNINGGRKLKATEGLFLKIATTKMRCSIKVKDEFENTSDEIYLKTKVFEGDILSDSWKSEYFAPTLCQRWDNSTIIVPLIDDYNLQRLRIEVSVAAKSTSGRKIVLGTFSTGPAQTTALTSEHWNNVMTNRGTPYLMWHNLE